MNNYEYIIATLPVLKQGASKGDIPSPDEIIGEIRGLCPGKDVPTVDFLLQGFDPGLLDEGFYTRALSHPDRFIRGWFGFDLMVRNRKAAFVNRALGRPEEMDVISLEDPDPDEAAEVDALLSGSDLLERERALDTLMWEKASSLTALEVLSLDVVLGYLAQLKITDRWLRLDPATGRDMFRRLVEGLRSADKDKDN